MQGAFIARHEARATFRSMQIPLSGEEGRQVSTDGRMMHARKRRLLATTGPPLITTVPAVNIVRGVFDSVKKILSKIQEVYYVEDDVVNPRLDTNTILKDFSQKIGDLGMPHFEELHGSEHYIMINGLWYTTKMLVDTVRWRPAMSLNDQDTHRLLSLLFASQAEESWKSFESANPGLNPREHDGHNRGSLAKCFLQIVKTSCLDREEGDPSIESFDITFSSWIDILWKDLSDFRKLKSLESMYTKDIVRGWAIENSAFEDIEDFRVQVLNCISPDLQMIGLYLENAYREESEHSDQVHAQQLDSYYANLVKGAMVNTSMSIVWGASNETEHSTHDEEMFSSILWNTLLKVMDSEAIKRGVNNDQHILSTVARVKHIKAAMKDIWEQSKLYRITNEVHMVEAMVIQRLTDDGVFPSTDSNGCLGTLKTCFLMRRHPSFRYHFAAVVGKRMASERLLSSSRSSIMEHHRSASWAEREYLHMYNLVSSKSAELCNCMANPEGFMVYDYTDMSRTNHQRNTSAIALRYVNRVDET